ncbi:unnamed protein product (macronuclear) [Paramecium tetraurelia]|uniref:Transmembrane protein n=1 Tax=Paramecium tetraurelia TaxID=5888 RepID=A0ECE5_PARTE|nr:uncharacterized protein GSPATT00003831001 [Paramecium tetraurelia]CAK92962.1 unnamed protein product [Paramecium tetraurelia]|eukprot:XP_001460359.1 hypothetical protein (macronuclear) [Paramecium tetraurelia strain d4-2]
MTTLLRRVVNLLQLDLPNTRIKLLFLGAELNLQVTNMLKAIKKLVTYSVFSLSFDFSFVLMTNFSQRGIIQLDNKLLLQLNQSTIFVIQFAFNTISKQKYEDYIYKLNLSLQRQSVPQLQLLSCVLFLIQKWKLHLFNSSQFVLMPQPSRLQVQYFKLFLQQQGILTWIHVQLNSFLILT